MAFPRKLKDLCTPAFIYFFISMIGLIMLVLGNLGNSKHLSLGSFIAHVPNTTMVFIVNLIYILFWTWILNLICRDGHSGIAWFLVLLPFIFLFIGLLMLMVYGKYSKNKNGWGMTYGKKWF
jgi:hypothetical protein